jgi:hypothetical protein
MSGAHVISANVLTTLSAFRFVTGATATAQGVIYPPSVSALLIGVTTDTVLDTVNSIPVQTDGTPYVFFNDTMAAGELVSSDTSGRGIPFTLAATSTAISGPANYGGMLWGAAVGTTGAIEKIVFRPGFDRRSV